ncbi:cilia- and flagella-associated protein 46 isoform X2 [Gouania willdenowi]|uniref:cilia- and flagella-associated protein 46 isoform X2 n=1 Tax=Gouania willdenowi TaxID=441366 RepID=UPI001055AD1C|nr:cilia- and flagella-associated protein 46 isoform X2 [Gouania willdenowi]
MSLVNVLCVTMMDDLEEAVRHFSKEIETSKKEPSYHHMVFNASVLYFQKVRPLLQPGQSGHVAASLRQVLDSLEEVEDKNHCWRAELMIHLIACLVDAGTIEDAASYAKIAEDFIKTHASHLYPKLFTLLVKHKLFEMDILLKTSSQSTALAVIYQMQQFKSMYTEINKYKVSEEDIAKLEGIFSLLAECPKATSKPVHSSNLHHPAPIVPSDRCAFLLELALLALQVKHQKLATDCLKELKSAGQATIDQCIMMECISSEIKLLEKKVKMSDYSRGSVEARLSAIHKLDQLLQTALREAAPQTVQAVCVAQWNTCLMLLQHNLRNHIKKPLLRISQALENIQSMLVEVRCQVHSELAAIEEEEGRLEISLTHLQKAMVLDNGLHQERLLSAMCLLQLKINFSQSSSRVEDKAAFLMDQVKDKQPEDDCRHVLVTVGLLLASDDFQEVLNADDPSRIPVDGVGSGPASHLAARAHHHLSATQNVNGHLAKLGSHTDRLERLILWATLSKTARKLQVWDVCRAACRFCLLYDDGKWSTFLLRLLAEIYFVSAEATIQKLFSEGVRLNNPGVLPKGVSETDPHWITYRNWIQALSAHATSNFLRAGELGEEIGAPGMVTNTATYLWNYNNHLLAAGDYQGLLQTFQTVMEMLERAECTRNSNSYVLLCDAVARGLIQPKSEQQSNEVSQATYKSKESVQKDAEVPNPPQDISKALKLCEEALRMCSRQIPDETVSIAVIKRMISTWVQVKRLLQQQININMDLPKDESENEETSAVMRVLVGVEMFQCNRNFELMNFSLPSLSTLVSMASECSWSDPMVELEVWCQLAASSHEAKEYHLVLSCTAKALQLEKAAVKALNCTTLNLYGQAAVNELLSSTACLRGLCLLHESRGNLKTYREGMRMLLSSASFAEKGKNPTLCVRAAKHYWNACLPLTKTPEERSQIQGDLEKILSALLPSIKRHNNQNKVNYTSARPEDGKLRAADEGHLDVRTGIYSLLYQIRVDKGDLAGALRLLNKALENMSGTEHWLTLVKYRILMNARMGESIQVDMQRFQNKGEQCCSQMWHQAALCAGTRAQQQHYYQKAIACLESPEWQWQKIKLLLEFGGWLYCHNFSMEEAQQQVQRALQILQEVDPEQDEGAGVEFTQRLSSFNYDQLLGENASLFTQSISSQKVVRCLDLQMQAHTLLAVMAHRASPDNLLNLLRAYVCVLRIWEVSMLVVSDGSSEISNSPALHPPPSAESKKGGKKSKLKKMKNPTPADGKPTIVDFTPPSTLREFACYVCPDQARQTFRTTCNPHCINKHSITNGKQSLHYLDILEKQLHSLSLEHMTLPIMHLAETIAHDILDGRSLSDLYRLRIVRTCAELGLMTCSPYEEKLQTLSAFQLQEQMEARKTIFLTKEKRNHYSGFNQEEVWLDKAEVCQSLGLYQSAWQHLAEAHLVAKEFEDQNMKSRSLVSLANLACKELDFSQVFTFLKQAQTLGGDEYFWYQFTLTTVTAVVGQRDQESYTKVDEIIRKGCGALKLLLKDQVNRLQELTFLITSLEMRGAVANIHIIGGEPRMSLSTEAVDRLLTASDTLRECASAFTKLNYQENAAEAHAECAHALSFLANHISVPEEKQRVLLDGLYQMELAVSTQQHSVLNVVSLSPSQEENQRLSLVAMSRLMCLYLVLVEFCLVILEEHCALEINQTLGRQKMTAAEKVVEEFTRSSPEPQSKEEEWARVGKNLWQTALSHLTAANSYSLNNVKDKAFSLSLLGKYLRLMAVHEDPVYMSALWTGEKKEKSHKAGELLAQASKALAEASDLCLQHNLPSSILTEAAVNMLECYGQSDLEMTGQYLALFQSCCTAAVMDESQNPTCTDTRTSQLAALLDLRRNMLEEGERFHSILKKVENSHATFSKGFTSESINPNHLSILTKLPPNQKILLLQHSQDRDYLYGAFYEMIQAPLKKSPQDSGNLTCSRVAKVAVSPQALLELREHALTYGQKSRQAFQETQPWPRDPGSLNVSEAVQDVKKSSPHFIQMVKNMDDYLNPLLAQLNISCSRPQAVEPLSPEMIKTKDGKERGSSGELSAHREDGLVILADQLLHELPLESLSMLQEEGLTSVSRDFSLQHFYSRLKKEEPHEVKSDNKKDTKGGKGTKGKRDQGQAIKAV